MLATRCARCCAAGGRLLSTSPSLAPPRGMPDVLPPLARAHRRLVAAFWALTARAGYAELAPPLLEHTALFARSLGDTSDVVSKEMYSLQSPQGGGAGSSRAGGSAPAADAADAASLLPPPPPGTSLTLRPEGTAGVLRAVLAAGLHRGAAPARVAYAGAMFRHERPQRGRQRQFTQVGLELVGASAAGAGGALEDVEVIALAAEYLRAVLPPGARQPALLINTLGSDTRAHARALAAHFDAVRAQLSPDSQARLARGAPLRILDSKHPADAPHIARAPPAALPPGDAARFDAVLAGLRALGIEARTEPRLVRGLDYYAHTIFEFVDEGSGGGGGSTVLAGGRYDRLPAQLLGGASSGGAVSAIGWAAGVERLHLLAGEGGGGGGGEGAAAALVVAVLPVGAEDGGCGVGAAALGLWAGCRRGAARGGGEVSFVPLPPRPSLQWLLAKANATGAGVAVIVRAEGVLVKDMRSGAQCGAEGAEGVLAAVARVQRGEALA